MTFPRRSFLLGAAAAASAVPALGARLPQEGPAGLSPPKGRFGLRYAPHFGMFKASGGPALADQLRFMADEGFTALEDGERALIDACVLADSFKRKQKEPARCRGTVRALSLEDRLD